MGLLPKPDFVLLHPPSVYEHRKLLNVQSPIADLIPSGTSFEMYPIGFSFLGEYLERHGINTRVINLATRIAAERRFDARRLMERLDPRAFGIGLHWLPSCNGALETARICKQCHPETPVVMGGYTASLFSREIMERGHVDFIIRGDSAEDPLLRLLDSLERGTPLEGIPNLTYINAVSGDIVENSMEYVPDDLGHLGDNYLYMLRSAVKYRDLRSLTAFKGWWSYPITAVLTCRGCLHNCVFCGGSSWSMSRCFNRKRPAFRTPERIADDVRTVSSFTGAPIFIIGDLRQNGDRYAYQVLEMLGRIRPRNHIVLELFGPAPREFFRMVAGNIPRFDFEISPESHDEDIRLKTGKPYTNRELENNLGWALESGCGKFDVFFMVGLPGQDSESVMETVSYCGYLLDRYGKRLNPLMGPLAPFLDPCSIAQVRSGEYGYDLIFESLEDYEMALLEPNWRDMLSYRTRLMSREQMVGTTYRALDRLFKIKAAHGQISEGNLKAILASFEENARILERLDRAKRAADPELAGIEQEKIKKDAQVLWKNDLLLKRQLEWPVVGPRFRYLKILRMLIGDFISGLCGPSG